MATIRKTITFFGRERALVCDGLCSKAFGKHNRPREKCSDDPDDYGFLADFEVGEAPIDPGTYEGDCGKPPAPSVDNMNKWCARECERSSMIGLDTIIKPTALTKRRVYNVNSRNVEE